MLHHSPGLLPHPLVIRRPTPLSLWEGLCIVAATTASAIALIFLPELVNQLISLLWRLLA